MKTVTKTYSNFSFSLLITSYVLGFVLFLASVFIAFFNAGLLWTIIGILCAGFGVILVAIIFSAINNAWITSIILAVSFLAISVLRNYAKSLAKIKVSNSKEKN